MGKKVMKIMGILSAAVGVISVIDALDRGDLGQEFFMWILTFVIGVVAVWMPSFLRKRNGTGD